jgi:hypothetical protein
MGRSERREAVRKPVEMIPKSSKNNNISTPAESENDNGDARQGE